MTPFVFVLLTFAVASQAADIYQTCGGDGEITKIDINGCTSPPCTLQKGTDASMSVTFKAPSAAAAVDTQVYGLLPMGIKVPFAVPNGKACESGQIKCPLTPGDEYEYKIKLPVSKFYPSLRLVVEWNLNDENGEKLICFRFPAQLKS